MSATGDEATPTGAIPRAGASVVIACPRVVPSLRGRLEAILTQPCVGELVVVIDDEAQARGAELAPLLAEPRLRLHLQPPGAGDGAAVRRGLAVASLPHVILQEPASQDDPSSFPRLLAPLVQGVADVVLALEGRPGALPDARAVGRAPWRALLERSGRRAVAFRREVLDELTIEEDGAGVRTELTTKVVARGWRVVELGLCAAEAEPPHRAAAERRPRRWQDELRELYGVLRYGAVERLLADADGRGARPASFAESEASLQAVLTTLDGAHHYADWVVSRLVPHLRGDILEIGAGHGTMTERLARFGHVTANDMSEQALRVLRQRFAGSSQIDVAGVDDELARRRFDTVVLVNVLEHVEDDVGMLRQTAERLSPGGSVIVLVPALPALMSSFDRAIGHHRRYTRGGLLRTAFRAGLEVSSVEHLNSVGVLGWWLVAKRLGRAPTAPLSVKAYDALVVPWLRRLEEHAPPPLGQSLILVAGRAHAR